MAVTFQECSGFGAYQADDVEDLEVDTDILSDRPTGYFAIIGNNKIEVSEEVYEALKKYKNF